MSKVYGQKPTNAISAVVRHDELADSVTQESDLKRKQSIGQIGETLPLVFCRRQNNVGGTWVSPRIIGVGLEQNTMSLIYPLSVGSAGGARLEEIFVGYNKFNRYTDAYKAHAYEEVPPGLEVSYNPGGSTSWTERIINSTLRSNLPNEEGDSATTISSQSDTCTGMEFTVNADITVDRKEYASIDGYAGYVGAPNANWEIFGPKARSVGIWNNLSAPPGWVTDVAQQIHNCKLQTWNQNSDMSPRIGDYGQNGPFWSYYASGQDKYSMSYIDGLYKRFKFKTNYYARCQVINTETNEVVKTAVWNVTSGTKTFKITNLDPAPYEFVITYHSLTNGKTPGVTSLLTQPFRQAKLTPELSTSAQLIM